MGSTQNIVSFCTGYGGLELGLRRVSPDFRTICYVEIEAYAIANLVAKIEQDKLDAAPIWTDIKTFDGRPFCRKVHGIIAGYPCQPFSNAGQRKGTEDPRHLWPHIEKHIRTIRPVWCFFENVPGHLTLGFKEVFSSLRDMGYEVEAGLFTAAEIDAPHKRERLFILAVASGARAWHFNKQIEGQNRSSVLRQENGQAGTGGTTTASQLAIADGQHGRSYAGGRDDNTETRSTGEKLADATSLDDRQRCENQQSENESIESGGKTNRRYSGPTADSERTMWPARPGQKQFEWEEPRTVKSGMGRTANGYPCRVDRLRLLGNGIVPQCAELAFRTLWEKQTK